MEKEFKERDEGPEASIRPDSLRATLNKIPNWKTPGDNGILGFWFEKIKSINNRLAKQLTRSNLPEWKTKRENYPG